MNEPDDRERWIVRVFRDDPAFDTHEKWWMIPEHVLDFLYVCSYDYIGHSSPTPESKTIQKLHDDHPGCVLVY